MHTKPYKAKPKSSKKTSTVFDNTKAGQDDDLLEEVILDKGDKDDEKESASDKIDRQISIFSQEIDKLRSRLEKGEKVEGNDLDLFRVDALIKTVQDLIPRAEKAYRAYSTNPNAQALDRLFIQLRELQHERQRLVSMETAVVIVTDAVEQAFLRIGEQLMTGTASHVQTLSSRVDQAAKDKGKLSKELINSLKESLAQPIVDILKRESENLTATVLDTLAPSKKTKR